jgi:DNA-binding response OmpR family regulator
VDDVGTARILVVDDDAFLRQLVTGLLRRDGHEVSGAASAEEARCRLAAGPEPDLLVLDIELPDLNGLDLLSEVRGALTCPVILMSGNDTESNREAGATLGAADYVVKPFAPKEFVARVRAALAP